jgi:hypothetical protein
VGEVRDPYKILESGIERGRGLERRGLAASP